MKRVNLYVVAMMSAAVFFTSGCTYKMHSMANSNARLQLEKEDVQISETKTATAISKEILGVDWRRLFKREVGEAGRVTLFNIPIIGNSPMSRTESYAAYNLLKANPEYDAVVYPQYEGVSKGFPFIYVKTEVTVKAKLMKINP